jgi:hypothetical protein
MTNEQLMAWAEEQRIAYRAGELSPDQIKLLSDVPGWSWARSESHRKLHIESRGKLGISLL